LQEYERFKKAAEDIDHLSRQERDTMTASADMQEHKVVKLLPDVTLQEMLSAFRDVLSRAEKFAHHHVSRERLSVRQRMSDILSSLQEVAFFDFSQLFKAEEGRMGVTVTFIAILELMKEGLIEIVQAEAYAPIHVRTAQGQRHLKVVPSGGATADADAENEAALAQPELAGENDVPEEEDQPPADENAAAVEAAVADVAAASQIVVENADSDEGFVAVAEVISDVVAATESAVENIPADEVVVEQVVAAEATLEEVAAEEIAAEEIAAEEIAVEEITAAAVVDESVFTETVEEHVVEEHIVPEHVVEENVVTEHVVEEQVAQLDDVADDAPDTAEVSEEPTPEPTPSIQTDTDNELSAGDDSVTGSSSEADNSDAEPTR
jgi:hypothetical protein